MKIAFLGKGGSGKTTLSSLTTRLSPQYFKETYVIDADINMHMKSALGLANSDSQPFLPVFQYYEGHIRATHPGLSALSSLPRTLPLWSNEDLITPSFTDVPFNKYKAKNASMLFELGGYSEKNMGWSCHHSSLGKLQLVLSHTNDADDQLIIVDLTAGADVFGVGMLGLFDKVFVAVEPTLKSIGIFKQLQELAAIDQLKLIPIANKVIDASDLEFIEEQIGEPLQSAISMSNFVRRLERGEQLSNGDIETETVETIREILSIVKSHTRDSARIYMSMVKAHERAADNWPKNKFGSTNLRELINSSYKGV